MGIIRDRRRHPRRCLMERRNRFENLAAQKTTPETEHRDLINVGTYWKNVDKYVVLRNARVFPGTISTDRFESENQTLNPMLWMLTAVEGCIVNIFLPYSKIIYIYIWSYIYMFDFSMLCRVNHPLIASPNKNFAAIICFFSP